MARLMCCATWTCMEPTHGRQDRQRPTCYDCMISALLLKSEAHGWTAVRRDLM